MKFKVSNRQYIHGKIVQTDIFEDFIDERDVDLFQIFLNFREREMVVGAMSWMWIFGVGFFVN